MDWRQGLSRRELLRFLGLTAGVLAVPGLACTSATSKGPDSAPQSGAQGAPSAGGQVQIFKGAFTATMSQNPQGLDPQLNSLTESFQAMLAMYEQLVDYDPCTDKFYPQLLAEMPDMSDTSKFVFNLRKNVKFHDGTPLTAEDVKYTFDFILKTGKESPAWGLYNMIDKVTVLDPHKIEFKLKYSYGLFIPYLASIMGGIVKKDARAKGDLRKNPGLNGCGPFKFVEWVDGDHLTFERFADYHVPGVPKYEKLVYKILVDESARVTQLLAGTVDFSDDVPKKDFLTLTKRPGLTGKQGLSEKVAYVMFNFKNPLFQNKDLRKAMNYAVDKEAILKNVFSGLGGVAHGPLRPGTPWYDPKIEEVDRYDPEKAKFHLNQAGYGNGVAFDVLTQNNQVHVNMSQLLQDMWRKVGINVNVIPMEKTALFAKAVLNKPDWTAVITDWSSSVYAPDYMLKLVYKSDGSYQRSAYSNKKVDELLEAAQKTGDDKKQKELLSQIALEMAEDVAAIFMVWEAWTPVWRDHVKGYCVAPTYYDYFDQVTIEKK